MIMFDARGASELAKPSLLIRLLAFSWGLTLLLCPGAAGQGNASDAKRIMIVYENESTLFAVQEVARGLQESFQAKSLTGFEFYPEYLDIRRFPAPDRVQRLASGLAAKYRERQPDIVLVVGPDALRFVLTHRSEIVPGKPLVFGGVTEASAKEISPGSSDIRGIVSRFDLVQSTDFAMHIRPDARKIVVLTGSSDFDRQWQSQARETFGAKYKNLDVEYLSDLSLEGFKRATAKLKPDILLLVLSVFEDADGRKFVPREAISEIVGVSGAPAFSVYSSLIGGGVVGGFVETFEGIGQDMAILAQQILEGTSPESQFIQSTGRQVVDWRQIQRWGIDPALLSNGVKREFYDPTAWERFRLQIIGALAIIALQSATITGLIVSERRRRRIQEELSLERLELAHLSRSAQLSALSGSIAHELNQPLTSILANAEVGARLVEENPANLIEIKAILDDIVTDDKRAATIIAQLRQLMIKGEIKREHLDLNGVVTATISLAHSELVARQTRVVFHHESEDLPVVGSLAQLQQVVLNLLLNAADAMAGLPISRRRIEITTRMREDGKRELSVTDRGQGMPPEMRSIAFEPFVTTKANGLGLGLAICRSIAVAHGGTLAFEENWSDGTRIVLTLPSP